MSATAALGEQLADSSVLTIIERVRKRSDRQAIAADDFGPSIDKAELATRGLSGSSRAPCLMMMAEFEAATSGEVSLDEEAINSDSLHKRGMGRVSQGYTLFPDMMVGENLPFPLEVRSQDNSGRENPFKRALGNVDAKDCSTGGGSRLLKVSGSGTHSRGRSSLFRNWY